MDVTRVALAFSFQGHCLIYRQELHAETVGWLVGYFSNPAGFLAASPRSHVPTLQQTLRSANSYFWSRQLTVPISNVVRFR